MRQVDVTVLGILVLWWLAAKLLWTELRALGWVGMLAHMGTVGVWKGLFDGAVMLFIYGGLVFASTVGWVRFVEAAYWFAGSTP
jgi:hypothetical protein